MSNIERVPARSVIPRPATGGTLGERMQAGRTGRALAAIEHHTVVRTANVQGEGFVAAEKLREADHLGYVAITGHSFLRKWADHLAAGDPFAADDLRFFTDIVKLAKGEIVADAIDNFRCK